MIVKMANKQTKRFLFKQVENSSGENSYQFFVRTKKRESKDVNPVFLIDVKANATSNENSFATRIQQLFEFTSDTEKSEIIEHIISEMEQMNISIIKDFAFSIGLELNVDDLSMPESEKEALKNRFLECDF